MNFTDSFAFISPKIEIKKSPLHGNGVFANQDISSGATIERSLTILFATETFKILEPERESRHILCDYAYNIPSSNFSCMAMGYAMAYNHADDPNVSYRWLGIPEDSENFRCEFFTLKDIKAGEELTHSYGPLIDFDNHGGWCHLIKIPK